MARPGCLLIVSPSGWRLAPLTRGEVSWRELTGDRDLSPESIAEQVETVVHELGLARNRISVALDANSVVTGVFACSSAAELRNSTTLGYRLESCLPLAAEDFVADYIAHDGQVLGMATAINCWLPLVEALENRGLFVQSISPTLTLALQAWSGLPRVARRHLVVWRHGECVELLVRDGDRLLDWSHLPAQPDELRRALAMQRLAGNERLPIVLVNGDAALRSAVEAASSSAGDSERADSAGESGAELTVLEAPPLDQLAVQAARTSRLTPLVELRRGALAAADPYRPIRGSLTWFVAAAAVCLLCVAAACWLQAWNHESQLSARRIAQRDAYRQAFPSGQIPAGIVSRLESERAKVRGAHGGGSTKTAALPESALRVLHELLVALPQDMKFRLKKVRIKDGAIELDAELVSYAQANALVRALESGGFSVTPPTIQQIEDGVATQIRGSLQRETKTADRAVPDGQPAVSRVANPGGPS